MTKPLSQKEFKAMVREAKIQGKQDEIKALKRLNQLLRKQISKARKDKTMPLDHKARLIDKFQKQIKTDNKAIKKVTAEIKRMRGR